MEEDLPVYHGISINIILLGYCITRKEMPYSRLVPCNETGEDNHEKGKNGKCGTD